MLQSLSTKFLNNHSVIIFIPIFNKVELSIYPIPASDQVLVDLTDISHKDLRIDIYNFLGSLVLSENISSGDDKKILDISDLTSGTYNLSLFTGQERLVSKKLVVQHR